MRRSLAARGALPPAGFQAGASLDPPWGRYRATAAFSVPRAAGLSMRLSPMASIPALGVGIERIHEDTLLRFDPTLGRDMCVTRFVLPGGGVRLHA